MERAQRPGGVVSSGVLGIKLEGRRDQRPSDQSACQSGEPEVV